MYRQNIFCVFLVLTTVVLLDNSLNAEAVIGVNENPGAVIPENIILVNEDGKKVLLDTLINKPTILVPVYFSCGGICDPLLHGLPDIFNHTALTPGQDYDVITFSFDKSDTPGAARLKKKTVFDMLNKDFPEDSWHFLTGDDENIRKLTDAIGFNFKREQGQILHTAVIIMLSPNRKIIRYLYGISFLPFDIKMGVVEASKELPMPALNRALLYCFSYDPQGKRYVVNFLRISGGVIIFIIAGFAFFLVKYRNCS